MGRVEAVLVRSTEYLVTRSPALIPRSLRCVCRRGGRAFAGGSGQIVEHRLVGRTQPARQEHPAQPREQPDLGFMADDDGARPSGVGPSVNVRLAWSPWASATKANKCGR